ncbi:MAG: pyridoxal 5'-phosphate synthase glutaminase subunit PdxT [Acidobacteriota bacterium]
MLALQGDFHAHAKMLESLGAGVRYVRRPFDLHGLSGLVLPGGESTTLLKLMEKGAFAEALCAFHAAGGALFGTCAGMILLARHVRAPAQRSLGLIDIDVERNAYGRQIDSAEAEATWVAPELLDGSAGWRAKTGGSALPLIFIRAPRLTRRGPGVVPLARYREEDVLVGQGRVLAASFHPEISGDTRVHRFFLRMAAEPGSMRSGDRLTVPTAGDTAASAVRGPQAR